MLGREQSEDKVLPNFLYLITTLKTHLSKLFFPLNIQILATYRQQQQDYTLEATRASLEKSLENEGVVPLL